MNLSPATRDDHTWQDETGSPQGTPIISAREEEAFDIQGSSHIGASIDFTIGLGDQSTSLRALLARHILTRQPPQRRLPISNPRNVSPITVGDLIQIIDRTLLELNGEDDEWDN